VRDLSSLANPLIEHPPCPAPTIDQLRQRNARRRRRRVLAAGAVAAVVSAGLAVAFRESSTRVVTTGPAAPPPAPLDLSVAPYRPTGAVTVVEEGVAGGIPWRFVVYEGSMDERYDAYARDRAGTCFLLLEARPGADLPPGAGGCDSSEASGANRTSTGHGFAHLGDTTFVNGSAGNAVTGVRIELRDGEIVEVATHAVEGIDGRYWIAALPGAGDVDDYLARANEQVEAVVPITSGAPHRPESPTSTTTSTGQLARFSSTATPAGFSPSGEGPTQLPFMEPVAPIQGYQWHSLAVYGEVRGDAPPFQVTTAERVTVRGAQAYLQRADRVDVPRTLTLAWTERPGVYLAVITRGAVSLEEAIAFAEGLMEAR
jgi:hypothetical protein